MPWPATTAQLQGRPKEYATPGRPDLFIGRYTQAETSHPDFMFPGQPFAFDSSSGTSTMLSPMDPTLPVPDLNSNNIVDRFEVGGLKCHWMFPRVPYRT